jgi:DNA polymerase-3 subunit beta
MPFITLTAGELSNAASRPAATAASYRGKNDILSRVRLIIANGVGFFSAANGAQTVTQRFTVADHDLDAGTTEVLFDGAKLRSIIGSYKTLPTDTKVKIQWEAEFGASKGVVSAARSRLKIDTDDPAAYPAPIKMDKDAVEIRMGLEELQYAIRSARHAVADNHATISLNGLNMAINKERLTFTSTDGHRLYTANVAIETDSAASSVLPVQVLELVGTMQVKTLGEEVRVKVDSRSVEFTSGSTLIRSSLIDGQYPETGVFTATEPQWFTELDKAELVAALSRLQAGVNSRLPAVTMTVDVDGKSLNLTTTDKGEVMGEDSVPLTQANPCAQTLSFNLNYLLDAFHASMSAKTKLGVNQERGFLVLQADNKKSLSIVMPMSV